MKTYQIFYRLQYHMKYEANIISSLAIGNTYLNLSWAMQKKPEWEPQSLEILSAERRKTMKLEQTEVKHGKLLTHTGEPRATRREQILKQIKYMV